MAQEVVVALRGVSFTYRNAAVPALRAIDLDIHRGQFVVLMGATGAGKTTLAKCLNCSIPQFQPGELTGAITLLGRSLAGCTVSDLAGVVGLVSQDFEAQLFATNVRQEVAFGLEQLGVPRPDMQRRLSEALELVGLAGFAARDPGTLSGGEKQRLAIAALLALEPALLVFDEPTTDLDPLGKAAIFDVLAALRQRGSTILLIEHETEAATRADRLLLMEDGRLVADDAPPRLLRDVALLERLGVRPLDLDRIAAVLGWPEHVATLEEAAARLNVKRWSSIVGRQSSVEGPASPQPAKSLTIGDRRPTTDDRQPTDDRRLTTDDRPTAAALIEVEHIDFSYPNGPTALRDVSLTIRPGEFVAIIGQNGSGKTTLAKCLNGLLRPRCGTVRLRGVDLAALPLNRVAADVGYVFQNPDHQIFAATVEEEVAFALRNFGVAPADIVRRTHAALAAVGLQGMEAVDPFLLGKGQRERLAVASFLALEPAMLILDEPTTGLDYLEQRRMLDLLARLHTQGTSLVVITHAPWVVAEYAARGILLQSGAVVFDGPLRALFAEEELLERSHFRLPDVTRLGLQLGLTPLSVEEILAAFGRSQ
jgi:energy-coupling factor transport system ATP-binding protein